MVWNVEKTQGARGRVSIKRVVIVSACLGAVIAIVSILRHSPREALSPSIADTPRTEVSETSAVSDPSNPNNTKLPAPVASDSLRLDNPEQHLTAQFHESGIEVTPSDSEDPPWRWAWQFSGCGKDEAPAQTIFPSRDEQRIRYARAGLTEWYENTPEGIEQGFTIERRPKSGDSLIVRGALETGLRCVVSEDRQAATFIDASGDTVLRYAKLKVTDSSGAVLPASIRVRPGELSLEVDDTRAIYPITIDPLLTGGEQVVYGEQGGSEFGAGVSGAGDLNGDGYADVVVGAPGYGTENQGKVYVYYGSPSGLSEATPWTFAETQANARLGYAVAGVGDINGDEFHDVAFGAPGYSATYEYAGRVYAANGDNLGLGPTPNWQSDGAIAYGGLGMVVAGIRDTNGDGMAEIAVGAPGSGQFAGGVSEYTFDDIGTVVYFDPDYWGYIIEPGVSSITVQEDAVLSSATLSLEYNALLYGWVSLSSPFGGWEVCEGATLGGWSSRTVALSGVEGQNPTGQWTLTITSDEDGADVRNVVLTLEFQEPAGRVCVFFGSSSNPGGASDWSYTGTSNGKLGLAISGYGSREFAVGEPLYSNGQTGEGRVLRFRDVGNAYSLDGQTESGIPNVRFGASLAHCGDLNATGGHPRLAAGLPEGYTETESARTVAWADGDTWEIPYGGSATFSLTLGPLGTITDVDVLYYIGNWIDTAHISSPSGTSVKLCDSGYELSNFAEAAWSDEAESPYPFAEAEDSRSPNQPLSAFDGESATGTWHLQLNSTVSVWDPPAWIGYLGVAVTATKSVYGSRLRIYDTENDGIETTLGESAQPDAAFGAALAQGCDFNGDGFADVFIGAPLYDTTAGLDSGLVRGYFGGRYGLPDAPSLELKGTTAGLEYGAHLQSAGDVNGDGYSDIVVGCPEGNKPGVGITGRLQVRAGGGDTLSTAGITEPLWTDPNWPDGKPTAAVGDVNADGLQDFVISDQVCTHSSNWASTPCVWYAVPSVGSFYAGSDVNGDGYSDLIVGDPDYSNGSLNEGRVSVYYGSAAGVGNTLRWEKESNRVNAQFGTCVTGLGDVNGDGYGDFAAGCPGYDGGIGSIEVYFGCAAGVISTPVTLAGDQANSGYGTLIRPAGDLNGDGFLDLLIAASSRNGGAGRVWAHHGSPEGLSQEPAWTVDGTAANARMGFAIAGLGDVNRDGYGDVAVSAPGAQPGEDEFGCASLFLGGIDGLAPSPVWTATGDQANGRFGETLSGIGDVNNDGYADLAVGAPGEVDGQYGEIGNVYLYLGSATGFGVVSGWEGRGAFDANDELGIEIAAPGDVNGDGYPDVFIRDNYALNLFYGGGSRGPALVPRQHNAGPGGIVPDGQLTISMDSARTPLGPMRAKLEWEIKPYPEPFDGTDLGESANWTQLSGTGTPLSATIAAPELANGYCWRARIKYHPADSPLELHSPWYRPHWTIPAGPDFRTSTYVPPYFPGDPSEAVSITPASPKTTQSLVATVQAAAVYSGLTPEYRYTWSTGTDEIASGWLANTTNHTLSSAVTSKHETWTCSVEVRDGTSQTHLPATASVTIVNTPPTAPTVSLPTVQSTSANLVAQITSAGTDADGDAVQYAYDWYVKHNGEAGYSAFRTGTLTSALSDQINDSDTADKDYWYVVVRTWDGEEWGANASTASTPTLIVQGGVEPSFISLSANPSTVPLGQPVTLSGQIFPSPLPGATVVFRSTSPSGPVYDEPSGVTIPGSQYSQTYVPGEASEGRTPWRIAATFTGDATYRSSTSDPPTEVTVLKSSPALSLTVSHGAALTGLSNVPDFAVRAKLTASELPLTLQGLLNGRSIRLSVARTTLTGYAPQGTVSATTALTPDGYVATFTRSALLGAGIAFDVEGEYKFKAEFLGNTNFEAAATEDWNATNASVSIKRGAGYALLIQGRIQSGEGTREHAVTLDYVYRVLRARSLEADDIFYLRQPTPDGVPTDIEVARDPVTSTAYRPTATNIAKGFQEWLVGKVTDSPGPVYVILGDHGGNELFYVDDPATGGEDCVTPDQLDQWLRSVEDAFSGNPQEILVAYGACHAASFVPTLSREGRVIIASCRSDEQSYRGADIDPDDGQNVRDGEYFLTELFRGMGEGLDMLAAFEGASARTSEYTATSSSGGGTTAAQHPMLWDGAEGAYAQTLLLGLSPNAAWGGLGWYTATTAFSLAGGAGLDRSLSAETSVGRALVLQGDDTDEAWLEVKTPGYAGGTVADPSHPELQRVVSLVGPVLPSSHEDLGSGKVRFTWSPSALNAYFTAHSELDPQLNFRIPGTYKVYYFLRDHETHQVSAYMVTNVYVPVTGNTGPGPVELLYPHDGGEVYETTYFAWGAPAWPDPQGDAVSFRLEIWEEGATPAAAVVVRDGLESQFVEVGGLEDGQAYRWRVIPMDEYGAHPPEAQLHEQGFTVRNNNPALLGAIEGKVVDRDTGAAIRYATVELSVSPWSLTSSSRGEYFVGDLSDGVLVDVRASAAGYVRSNWVTVWVSGGTLTTVPTRELARTFALRYSAGANGTVKGVLVQTVEHGDDGTPVEAVPAEGYRFEQWSDGSTQNPRTDTNVTADVSVTASFAEDTGSLQVTSPVVLVVGGSPVTISGSAVAADCAVSINGAACKYVVYHSGAGTITAIAPPGAPGPARLRVENNVTGAFKESDELLSYTADPFAPELDMTPGIVHTWTTPGGSVLHGWLPNGAPLEMVTPEGTVLSVPPALRDGYAAGFVIVRSGDVFTELSLPTTPTLPPGYAAATPGIDICGLVYTGSMTLEIDEPFAEPVTAVFPVTSGTPANIECCGYSETHLDDVLAPFFAGASAFGLGDEPSAIDNNANTITFELYDFTAYVGLTVARPADVNSDGGVNAQDVQLVINGALNIDTHGLDTDINGDGLTNAIDVQMVIIAALG